MVLTVPEPFASQLRAKRLSYGDAQGLTVPPHITLLPPTQIPATTYAGLLDHVGEVAAGTATYTVMLRSTGTFRPVSPVVFVQVARGIAECERLEAAIRSGPVERPLDFPYHPHVTVAHHLDDAALDRAFTDLATFSATFTAAAVDVYEHLDGRWEQCARLPLSGEPAHGSD